MIWRKRSWKTRSHFALARIFCVLQRSLLAHKKYLLSLWISILWARQTQEISHSKCMFYRTYIVGLSYYSMSFQILSLSHALSLSVSVSSSGWLRRIRSVFCFHLVGICCKPLIAFLFSFILCFKWFMCKHFFVVLFSFSFRWKKKDSSTHVSDIVSYSNKLRWSTQFQKFYYDQLIYYCLNNSNFMNCFDWPLLIMNTQSKN